MNKALLPSALSSAAHTAEVPDPVLAGRIVAGVSADFVSGYAELTKDDANYPHACLCPRNGCAQPASCPSFHFGQQEWTR